MDWKGVIVAVAAWEGAWWMIRRANRAALYADAKQASIQLGKPLIVIGAPDLGATGSPVSADDIVVDIRPSNAPNFVRADICQRLPFDDDSAVIFVSCVLEYVDDYAAAMRELQRVSGGYLFIARVEPWTLAGHLYPGAKRTIPAMAPPQVRTA